LARDGFYNHWTTYAEMLQLIASLTIGLFLAAPRKRSRNGALLALAIVGWGLLLLTSPAAPGFRCWSQRH